MNITIYNNQKPWYYTVKIEDEEQDLSTFLKKFYFSEEDFKNLNPTITKLCSGDVLIMPPSPQYYHVVSPLETYDNISQKYNTSVEHLILINKTKSIFVGQRIYI